MAFTVPSGVVTYTNQPSTTVATGGTAALSQGASEAWTVGSGATFPIASTSTTPATFFMVADTASTSEIVCVTVASTASPWVWHVTRGAEGTSPVTHATGFTVLEVVTAGGLANFKQATNAFPNQYTVSNSTVLTTIATYDPVPSDYATGTVFEGIAYGVFGHTAGAATTTQCLFYTYWGSTQILACTASSLGNEQRTATAAGSSWDLNVTVCFQSVGTSTIATANMNLFWGDLGATTGSGQVTISTPTAVSISGAGPLAMAMAWQSATATSTFTAVTSLLYRAC